MMTSNKMTKEDYDRRVKAVTDYLNAHDCAKSYQLKALLGMPKSTAGAFIAKLRAVGIIYRHGSAACPRYWLSKTRYQAWMQAKEDAEVERVNALSRKRPFKVSAVDQLIFLNRKRPSGINTVFEECKQNFGILPVLQVMAARRVA